MAVLEENSPQELPNVKPYLFDEYTANDTGVTDGKQCGKKSVLPPQKNRLNHCYESA